MWKFDGHDVRRLRLAIKDAGQGRLVRRLQTLLLVAQGVPPAKAARLLGQSRRTVFNLLARYRRRRRPADIADLPRTGRPKASPRMTAGRIRKEYRRDPMALGYLSTEWTVPLLAGHLRRQYHCPLVPRTLRRRLRAMGLVWKRPRYLYHPADSARAQKGALVRRVKGLENGVVVLFEDETILRLFPPLRAKWAQRGEQPVVRISGANAKRVLFGVINPKTGHRILMRGRSMKQTEFQAFLRLLHRRYHGRHMCLILDEASCHTAQGTRRLRETLGIDCLFLPKQSPELNPVDHLWRPVKNRIAANRQYKTVDQEADYVEHFIHHLSPVKTLRLAGILSKDFWLPGVCKNFWLPT